MGDHGGSVANGYDPHCYANFHSASTYVSSFSQILLILPVPAFPPFSRGFSVSGEGADSCALLWPECFGPLQFALRPSFFWVLLCVGRHRFFLGGG